MNQEDYVSYSQAVRLKKLGFDGCGLKNYTHQGYYKFSNGYVSPIKNDGDGILVQFRKENAEKIPAPSLSQAQKWLRDVKGALLYVTPDRQPIDDDYNDVELTGEWWWQIDGTVREDSGDTYKSYETALSVGLDAALKLLEEKL